MSAALPSSAMNAWDRIRRPLWRRVLQWRFRLFQRQRYNRLILEEVAGKPILVLPQVFNPALFTASQLLARALNPRLVPPGSTVLDMGAGSGIGAVFAAQWAARVVAVDVNPEAVRCARINVLLNRVDDRVEVIPGDLFEPVGDEQFDVVLFNPPFYRGAPRDALDQAWRSVDAVERFAAGLRRHLNPGGYALVVLSSDGEAESFLQAFGANRLDVEAVFQRDVINELLTVYKLSDAEC